MKGALLCLLALCAGASALSFTGNDFALETLGNSLPKYRFWKLDEPSVTYKVEFMKVYEAYVNKYGEQRNCHMINLNPYTWVYSAVVFEDNNSTAVFNMTAKGGSEFSQLTIQSHVFVSSNGVTSGSNGELIDVLKFDLFLNGYKWQCTEYSNASLVFAYKFYAHEADAMASSASGDNVFGYCEKQGDNAYKFGGAYFSVEPTATTSKGQKVHVSIYADSSVASGSGSMVSDSDVHHNPWYYVTYGHFDGDLVHDPSFGFADTSEDKSLEPWVYAIIVIGVVIGAALMLSIAVLSYRAVQNHNRRYVAI